MGVVLRVEDLAFPEDSNSNLCVTLDDMHRKEGKPMIGLLADFSSYFSDPGFGGIGLSGPIGLGDGGGDGVGLSGGVGLGYDAGSGFSVGLDYGVGLFA